MVKVVVLKPNDVKTRPDLVGKWLDSSHYHTLVEEDMDLYLPPDCAPLSALSECDKNLNCKSCDKGISEQNIVFKFRKNFFSKEEVDSAYAGLREAATETQNRGVAGGPKTEKCGGRDWVTDEQFDLLDFFSNRNTTSIFGDYNPAEEVAAIRNKFATLDKESSRGIVWLSEKVKQHNFIFEEFIEHLCSISMEEARTEARIVTETYISKTTYANVVNSGIAGWYDRYPRIPFGRTTSYTRDNFDKFKLAYPYLQSLARGFEELLPWRYGNQKRAADSIDPKFVVPGTPFTTITVNRNFRTAAHYDPANMDDGFANICVVSSNDNYSGAYLVFPEIGYAVNIRPGDLLFVNNMAGLHGNTELVLHDEKAERVSMIAFFHEGMLKLGTYDYENTRREFVESRRTNPDHVLQRNRWNGISQGMWCDEREPGKEGKDQNPAEAKEWYDYLKAKGDIGEKWLSDYHPTLKKFFEYKGIEDFF